MSDHGESDGYHSAIPFHESESDQESLYLPEGFDESSEDNYCGSDIEQDIEMDPKKWVIAKLDKKANEKAVVVYNPEIKKLRDMADEVKRARIKQETRVQYNNANVVYVRWLFRNFKGQFHQEYLERLNEAYNGGQDIGVLEEIEKIIVVEEACPVDPRKFEAVVFFSFLMTFKNSDGLYFSFSTYDGRRSALMHMIKFDEKNCISFKEMDELKKMMTGLRKSIIQQKKDLGLSVSEGKDSLSFEGYRLTCELMLKESTQESIFALAWLTTQWNLISRSEATETICFSQLFWSADNLKVYFAKHKSDQFGTNKDEPRHMYSNPIIPTVCPVRALATYFMLYPDIVSEGGRIFPGSEQRTRFGRIFHYFLTNYAELYFACGIDPKEIGTHSIRKGAATYCCTVAHPGPPVVSVCLRAGWSLGKVKERYLKYGEAGDELVGRTLTGISPESTQFGISPVFFAPTNDAEVVSNNLIKSIFPRHPPSLKRFLNICIASFVYHEEFTKGIIDNRNSPVLSLPYFSLASLIRERRALVTTALSWEHKEGCPPLTGIPIQCTILNKLYEIQKFQEGLPAQLIGQIIEALDKRMVGDASSILARRVMERVEKIGDEIEKKLHTEYNIGNKSSILNEDQSLMRRTMFREKDDAPSENQPRLLFPDEGIFVHFWDGEQRTVPKDFRFPKKMTLQALWTNWHIPSLGDKVSAYKHIKTADLCYCKRGLGRWNEMRMIVHELENAISKFPNLEKQYRENMKNLPVLIDVLEKVKHIFHTTKTRKSRLSQMSWESLVKDAREMFRLREKGVPPPPSSNKRKPRKQKSKSTKKKPAKKSSTAPPAIPPMPLRSNLVAKTVRTVRRKRPRLAKTNNPFGDTFKQTDESIILKRGRGNLFEKVTCAMCDKIPTQHRCTMKVKGSKLIDGANGDEICGYPVCGICRGEYGNEEGACRCKNHLNMTDV